MLCLYLSSPLFSLLSSLLSPLLSALSSPLCPLFFHTLSLFSPIFLLPSFLSPGLFVPMHRISKAVQQSPSRTKKLNGKKDSLYITKKAIEAQSQIQMNTDLQVQITPITCPHKLCSNNQCMVSLILFSALSLPPRLVSR